MPVRWPDGSLTGSLLRDTPEAANPVEPEPETTEPDEAETKSEKKEVKDGDR